MSSHGSCIILCSKQVKRHALHHNIQSDTLLVFIVVSSQLMKDNSITAPTSNAQCINPKLGSTVIYDVLRSRSGEGVGGPGPST